MRRWRRRRRVLLTHLKESTSQFAPVSINANPAVLGFIAHIECITKLDINIVGRRIYVKLFPDSPSTDRNTLPIHPSDRSQESRDRRFLN